MWIECASLVLNKLRIQRCENLRVPRCDVTPLERIRIQLKEAAVAAMLCELRVLRFKVSGRVWVLRTRSNILLLVALQRERGGGSVCERERVRELARARRAETPLVVSNTLQVRVCTTAINLDACTYVPVTSFHSIPAPSSTIRLVTVEQFAPLGKPSSPSRCSHQRSSPLYSRSYCDASVP